MIKKRELQAGVFSDNNLTLMKREMQGYLKNKAKEETEKDYENGIWEDTGEG